MIGCDVNTGCRCRPPAVVTVVADTEHNGIRLLVMYVANNDKNSLSGTPSTDHVRLSI